MRFSHEHDRVQEVYPEGIRTSLQDLVDQAETMHVSLNILVTSIDGLTLKDLTPRTGHSFRIPVLATFEEWRRFFSDTRAEITWLATVRYGSYIRVNFPWFEAQLKRIEEELLSQNSD